MKTLFRLALVTGLGVVAVALEMTLWNAWRTGFRHITPIVGAVTRRGISSADPRMVLCFMTVLLNTVFVTALLAWFFPGAGVWLRQKRDRIWPPAKYPDLGPSWICTHCHEENPGNFGECWKCQRIRAHSSAKD
jgi:hypothetical protein